jgi:protein CpxP
MSSIKFYKVVSLLLLISNIVMLYFLLRMQPAHTFHPDQPRNEIIEKLQFSTTQVQEYDKLIHQHRTAVRAENKKIVVLKSELYHWLAAPTIDSIKIKECISKLGIIQQDIEMIHFNHFLSIKALCTSQQMPQFNALSKEINEVFTPNTPGLK